MSTYTLIDELQAWFGSLSPEFAFLLALPFAVAAAAFAADWIRRRRVRRHPPKATARRSHHGRHHVAH